MKLTQFENHPVWALLRSVADLVTAMRVADSGSNLDAIQDLEAQTAYIQARFKARRRLAPTVFTVQLDQLHSQLQAVATSLQNAQANVDPARRQYLEQTTQYMHSAFTVIAAWVTVSPTVTEERAEVAVVDELMRRNGELDSQFKARLESLEDQARAVEKLVESARAEAVESEASLESIAEEAKRAVEAEKTRIGTVIDDGQRTIAGFEGTLQGSMKQWQSELSKEFSRATSDLRSKQQSLLDRSNTRYGELTKTIDDYQAIVQADSADRLAKHYEVESKSARKSGWTLTVTGGVVLLGATLPLLLVVMQPLFSAWLDLKLPEVDWTSFAARAGVSAVLVGAATVSIRMGSGFHRRSDDYKRLAMELRTMGPFLSTVEDSESVDQARLDLVNRTFGQAYAPQQDSRDEDAVPVSVIQQLFAMVTKVVK